MYILEIASLSGMKASAFIHPEVACQIGLLVGSQTSIPRDQLLTELGYPVGVGAKTGNTSTQLYEFIKAVLSESKSERFIVQIEAIPAHPALNPIFNSLKTLPEEDRELVVVFTDREIMSGVKYCEKHDEFHTRKGDVKKHLIHQWAYADDFYAQLNLPEFPEQKSKSKEFSQGIPTLLKLAILAAALSDDEQEKKPAGFKFH